MHRQDPLEKPDTGLIGLLIAAYYIISPLLYLLRIAVGDVGIASVLLRLLSPLLVGTILFNILVKRWRIDRFALVVLLIYGYGFCAGLLRGYHPLDVFSSAIHYFQGIFVYIWVLNKPNVLGVFATFLKRIVKIYVPIAILIIFGIYLSNALLGASFYLGLATQALIPVYFWSVSRLKVFWPFMVLATVFFSGKRSVLFAILIGLTALLGRDLTRLRIKKSLLVGMMVVLGAVMGVLVFGATVFERLLKKYAPTGDNFDFDTFSSGRVLETLLAFREWIYSPVQQIFGVGFGNTYLVFSDENPFIFSEINNIHLSYGNSLLVFGIPLMVLLHGAILYQAGRAIAAFNDCKGAVDLQGYTLVSYFGLAFFALVLYADPIFWMLLGVGAVLVRERRQKAGRALPGSSPAPALAGAMPRRAP